MIAQLCAVAIGGAFGALARFGCTQVGALFVGRDTWIATLGINVFGSFALGVIAGLIGRRGEHWPLLNSLLAIGFLGAFTTFSTYAVETLRLWQDGRVLIGVAFAVGSVVAALGAAWLGARLTLS